jgi:hypothetical protein
VMSAKAITSQNAEATPVVVVSGPDANTCYNEVGAIPTHVPMLLRHSRHT